MEGNASVTEEEIEAFAQAGSSDYFVCTNKNRPDILVDLNKAQKEMFQITPTLKTELSNRWFRNSTKALITSPICVRQW